jgi:hypothetical protein|tara:strand:+ start:30 stop:311 length:282 start_codon:yes stop_codon:yes gene_type:complete
MPLECDDASVLIDLNAKMERLMLGIDSVKEKQDTMADDITKIKEAVYNPDEGLYARIRELEVWKKNSTKLLWIIVTALVGLSTASVWSLMLSP